MSADLDRDRDRARVGRVRVPRASRRALRRREGDFSKGVVTLILAVACAFTIAILVLFARTGAEPATLISCFFAGVIAELWSLAGIKKRKIRAKMPRTECKDFERDEEDIRG